MKSDLRVLFMGTPDFAVHILHEILQANYNVVGVVSVPDKPAGRGQKMHESAVTKYAKEHNLNLLQPAKLKSKKFLEELKELNIDIAVVVAFRMLPAAVWQLPKLGTFNLHASLLPQYRGAAPINWAIINGETETGVTTFFVDEKIDMGSIILNKKVAILPDETAGELHDKLMIAGGELVVETLNKIDTHSIYPKRQKKMIALKDAPKIYREDCRVNWKNSLEAIHNFIRGLSPYPCAWTVISNDGEEKVLKIYSAQIQYSQHTFGQNHLFEDNQKLGIAHKDGIIWLNEIQLEGKRRMKSSDFLNGFNLNISAHVLDE